MSLLFPSRRLDRSPASTLRPSVPVASLQRASLDGLEVRDSTWDEWMAAEAAQREQAQASARADTAPIQRR